MSCRHGRFPSRFAARSPNQQKMCREKQRRSTGVCERTGQRRRARERPIPPKSVVRACYFRSMLHRTLPCPFVLLDKSITSADPPAAARSAALVFSLIFTSALCGAAKWLFCQLHNLASFVASGSPRRRPSTDSATICKQTQRSLSRSLTPVHTNNQYLMLFFLSTIFAEFAANSDHKFATQIRKFYK
jgi:hypothetical protein